jgi:hypothetical protein
MDHPKITLVINLKRSRGADDVDAEDQRAAIRIKYEPRAPDYTCTEKQWRTYVDYVGHGLVSVGTYKKLAVTPAQAVGNLQGPHHPVLNPQNFPPVHYDAAQFATVLVRMKPAFDLATRFLTNRIINRPWIHSQFGNIRLDDETNRRYLESSPEERKRNAYSLFQNALEQLKVVFVFAAMNPRSKENAQIHGLHILPNEPVADHWYVQAGSDVSTLNSLMKTRHTIAINAAYYEYYAQEQRVLANDVTTHVTLALTLAHEVFHAFSAHVRGTVYDAASEYEEPYFDLDQAQTAKSPFTKVHGFR